MTEIFCFTLAAGHRLESAIVYSRRSKLDRRELFTLHMKWKHAKGGCYRPLASVLEGISFINMVGCEN